MSFWKKTMDYLGLGPDDAYDDYDDQDEPEHGVALVAGDGGSGSRGRPCLGQATWPAESDETTIRAVPRRDRASPRATSSRRAAGRRSR